MRRSHLVMTGLALVLAVTPLHAQEVQPQPVDLVRALRVLQDRVAHGDAAAHQVQRDRLAQLTEEFGRFDAETWKEPRNARAAVAFVLSGGNPRVLGKLLEGGPLNGVDDKLARGALAYGRGRNAEAADLLAAIDARTLDASLAGHVALIQSELVAKKDPPKAMALLDEARLLSPGTLIEEAALRRQVATVAAANDFDRFEALSTRYLYRFPSSLYAGNFRRQFAGLVVEHAPANAARLAVLESKLAALDAADLREIYLLIAKEGLVKGKLQVTRFAAGNAVRLAEPDTADAAHARFYEVVVAALMQASDGSVGALASLEPDALGEDEAELLAAARSVVREVGYVAPGPARATEAQLDELAAEVKTVAQARQVIERIDRMLSEGGK
jgi:chemotaxis protein MotC